MLTCGFQELNLSLLEIWGNVKGEEKALVSLENIYYTMNAFFINNN